MDSKFTSGIVVVDDDPGDISWIYSAHKELKISNPISFMNHPAMLIEYLRGNIVPPFLILCEFNLPVMNGMELRRKLIADERNRYLSTPFLLWSTQAQTLQVKQAYSTEVQGFFIKPSAYVDLMAVYGTIISYWQLSLHPKPLS